MSVQQPEPLPEAK